MESAGYRKHETDWEIHRGAQTTERIVDAVISCDGKYVWTKIGADPAEEIRRAFRAAGLGEPTVQQREDIWIAFVGSEEDGPCVAHSSLNLMTKEDRAVRINNMVQIFKRNSTRVVT